MNDVGHKLLVIDDDDMVRRHIVAYLEDCDYDVLQASDGEQALALFKDNEKEIDIILCDLKMNGLQGLDVLQSIRKHNTEIPFIVISGHGTMDVVVKALHLGANNYLTKPVVQDIMARLIEDCLSKVELQRSVLKHSQELELANHQLQNNIDLLQRDQRAARLVQNKMLPKNHLSYGDYQFDYIIHPSVYISGDFVEFTPLTPQHLLFFIADVSGHGSACAFVTVFLKLFIDRLRTDIQHQVEQTHHFSPAQLLHHINDELISHKLDLHATLFLGIIDTNNNTLCYANAGHFPLPILSGTTDSIFLDSGESDLPVGLFEHTKYQEHSIALEEAFCLILLSDGVFEIIEAPSINAKEAHILQMAQEKHTDLDEMAKYLQFDSSSNAPDDITFMTVSKVTLHERR